MDDITLITPEEAAEFLKISVGTLAQWRTRGEGPKPQKIGHLVRYRMADLIDWLNAQQTPASNEG